MVDVQEQRFNEGSRKGVRKKSGLLHRLIDKFVTLADNSGESCGVLRYETERGRYQGFYFGNRQVRISEVQRVYPDQNRIELYSPKSDVRS